MKQKNYEYVPAMPGEFDFRDQNLKHNLSNHDYDLFKEEDDVVTSVVRVKRVNLPNKGENWKIFKDNKAVEVIEGVKLSTKEKEFLRTVQGIQFVIGYYKSGWKSFNNFRQELKKHVMPPRLDKETKKRIEKIKNEAEKDGQELSRLAKKYGV